MPGNTVLVEDPKVPEQVWKAFEKSMKKSSLHWHYCDIYLQDLKQHSNKTMAAIKMSSKGASLSRKRLNSIRLIFTTMELCSSRFSIMFRSRKETNV